MTRLDERPKKYDEKHIRANAYDAQKYHLFRCCYVRQAQKRDDVDMRPPTEQEMNFHEFGLCSQCEWIRNNPEEYDD